MRRLTGLALCALVLAACGSVSLSAAMVTWVKDNGFISSTKTLTTDAAHAATVLRSTHSSDGLLHLVCGVLLLDVQKANTPLPTPDSQSTKLLNEAYTDLASAANECYNASGSPSARARALVSLSRGVAKLSEGSARVIAASTP